MDAPLPSVIDSAGLALLRRECPETLVRDVRSRRRAQTAFAALTGAGRAGLSVLDGGMLDWVATGHPVVRAG